MDRPAQTKASMGGNMRSILTAPKPIKKLRVLQLRPRSIASWHNDAKTLATLWERMLVGHAVSPRLVPLFAKWATLLLKYGQAYGIYHDRGMVVKDVLSVHQNSIWLATYLATVSKLNGIQDVYGLTFKDFQVASWGANDGVQWQVNTCAILHTKPKRLAVYRTVFEEASPGNAVNKLSNPVGMETFGYIEDRIRTALKEHRAVRRQDALVQEIQKHGRRHWKERICRDRLFN